jgi:hypothetical protein
MYGWIQSGYSNTAFSNVNSNDFIIRTQQIGEKIIVGCGKDATRNATMYITSNAIGINKIPSTDAVLDIADILKASKDSNIYVTNSLYAPIASVCNLTVNEITYASAQANDLTASNLTSLTTTTNSITTSNLMSSNVSIESNLTVGSGIYPTSDLSATLGDANNRFMDLWLGGQSFHIGDTTLSQDPNGNLQITDNSETVFKRMIMSDVQIGDSSNPLRLCQSNDGKFVVYKVVDGVEVPMQFIDNIWSFECNIGIGVPMPTNKLEVDGNLKTTGYIQMNDTVTLSNDSSSSTLLINPTDGYQDVHLKAQNVYMPNKLGIGIQQPDYTLDVSGSARVDDLNITTNKLAFLTNAEFVDTEQNIPWYGLSVPSTNSNLYLAGKTGVQIVASNVPIIFDPMISGVGIGTSNVNSLLQLNDTDSRRKITLKEVANNDYQVVSIGNVNDSLVFQVPSSNNDIVFYRAIDETDCSQVMVVQGDGNVRIGSTTDKTIFKLDVEGNIRSGYTLLLGDATDTATYGRMIAAADATMQADDEASITLGKDYTTYNQAILKYSHNGENSESNALKLGLVGKDVMTLEASGKVGINTITPEYILDVQGNAFAESLATTTITAKNADSNVLSIGSDDVTATINIGTGDSVNGKTINIGGTKSSINIQGDVTWVNTTNTQIKDTLITLNKGGAEAVDCGIEFEQNSNVDGYIKTNATASGFSLKAPASSNLLEIGMESGISINNVITISQTSNIGFGTASNSSYMFHVQNSNAPSVMFESLSNDTPTIHLKNSNATWQVFGPVSDSNNALQVAHYDKTNDTWSSSFITVLNDGRVGLGLDVPEYALDVNGVINATGVLVNGQAIQVSGGGGTVGGGSAVGWDSLSSNIYTECNIGIKKLAPEYSLDVAGSINACNFLINGAPFTGGYWQTASETMYTLSNVGVGTNTPAYTLDVGGTLNALDILIGGAPLSSGFWQLVGGNMYSLCNVGVGTTNPTNKLDIVGNAKVTGNFTSTGSATVGSVVSSGNVSAESVTSTGVVNISSSTWGDGIRFNSGMNRIYTDNDTSSMIINVDTSSNLFITSTGNAPFFYLKGNTGFIGVGNSNPLYAFDVVGAISATSYCNITWSMINSKPEFASVSTSGSYTDLTNKPALCNVATTASYTDLTNKPALCNVATTASYTDLNNAPALCNIATTASYTDLVNKPALCNVATTASWNDIFNKPSGLSLVANNDLSEFSENVVFQQSVGIGVQTPQYALDVVGAVSATSYCNLEWSMINNPPLSAAAYSGSFNDLTTKPTNLTQFTNDLVSFSCNVGIKTANPEYTLHVLGSVYASGYCNLDWSMVQNAPDFARPSWSILTDAPSNLSFFTNDLSLFTNPVTISNSITATSYCNVTWSMIQSKPTFCNLATTGAWEDVSGRPTKLSSFENDLTTFTCNVGINTANPQYNLHVNGSLFASGYCNIYWNMINEKPTLCNIATSALYSDIVGKPTKLTDFSNDLSNFSVSTVTFDGKVGINNATPTYHLDVSGAINATSYCNIQWSMIQNAPSATDYNNLDNTPALCNIALSGSYADIVGKPSLCNVATTALYADLVGKPTLATVATSGMYGDLIGTPSLCNVALSSKYTDLVDTPSLCNVATTGSYADLTGTPSLCNIAITSTWVDINGKPTFCNISTTAAYSDLNGTPALCNISTTGEWNDIYSKPNFADVATSGDYNDLVNTPSLSAVAVTGSYTDLNDTPTYANVASSGLYSDLINKPILSVVAFSGSYDDLDNKPAGASFTGSYNDLTNKPTFSTIALTGQYADIVGKPSLASVAVTGNYADLSNLPALCNLATTSLWTDLYGRPSFCNVATTASYLDLVNTPGLCNVATSGLYSDLLEKPALCNIATSASYLDLADAPSLCNVATSGLYTDLYGIPSLCNVATMGTFESLDGAPSNLSAFSNDLVSFNVNEIFPHDGSTSLSLGCSATVSNINLGVSTTSMTINIGTGSTGGSNKVINIGEAGDTINVPGTFTSVNSTNTTTCNLSITLNNGGAAGSAAGAGILIEEAESIASYIKVSGDRNSFLLRTPAGTSDMTLNLANNAVNINANAFVINSNANVGIGTATPSVKFHVYGGDGLIRGVNWSSSGHQATLGLGDISQSIKGVYGTGIAIQPNNTTLPFVVQQTTGNVGVGTTTPQQKLHIFNATSEIGTRIEAGSNGNSSNNPQLYLCAKANSPICVGYYKHPLYIGRSSNGGNVVNSTQPTIVCTTSDLVGIGTTTPAYKLDVNGAINATSYCNVNYNNLTNKPSLAAVAYSGCNTWDNITGKPTFATVATSGSYTDLTSKPALCNIALSGQYTDLVGKPTYATVASSGSYSDLTNRPSLCNIALTGNYTDLVNTPTYATIATSGSWTDLSGVPLFSAMAYYGCNTWTNISEKPNLATIATTGAYSDLSGAPALSPIALSGCNVWENISNRPSLSAVAISGEYSDINGVPSLCNVATTGSYTNLVNVPVLSALAYSGCNTWANVSGKPSLCNVATSALYADLVGTPSLCNVATTGSYSSLVGTPSLSAIAYSGCNTWANVTGKPSFCNVATTGSYNDLVNKPTYATVASTGAYSNLSGTPSLSAIAYSGCNTWANVSGKPSFCNVATTGSYNDLVNKPTYATVASSGAYSDLSGAPSLSAIAYSGCNTWDNVTGKPSFCNVATTGSYNDLVNKPTYATVATSGSYTDLTSKPTALSSFTNDITYFSPAITFCNLVGIKNNTPTYDLDVAGTINACNILINGVALSASISTGYWQTSGVIQYSLSNIGVLTSDPKASLHVGNDMVITACNNAWNTTAGKGLFMRYSTFSGQDAAYIQSYDRSASKFHNMIIGASNVTIGANSTAIYARYDGKVGIGTTTPTQALEVNGAIQATSYCNVNYNNLTNKPTLATVATTGVYSDLTGTPSLSAIAYTGCNTWANVSGKPVFANIAYDGAWSNLTGTAPALTIFTNDLTSFYSKVTFNSNIQFPNSLDNKKISLYESAANNYQFYGFGVATSTLRYSVSGTTADHMFIAGTSSTTANELMRIKGTGLVGIGTSTVSDKLHVYNGNFRIDGANTPTIRLHSSANDIENSGELLFLESNVNDGYKVRHNSLSNAINILQLASSAETSKLWISTNIGVKTTNPLYDLHVNGSIYATSYCNVSYNDLLNKPSYATVASTGSYADLTGKPTTLSQFTNDLMAFSCNVAFSGTVGIGVPSPTATLDVNGSIKCSSLAVSGATLALSSVTSTAGTLALGCDNTTGTLNIGCPSLSNNTINIGTSSTTSQINLGSSTDTVTLNASSVALNSSSLTTQAQSVILNTSGNATSGASCGFQIYENSNVTGYIQTSTDRGSFLFKTPTGNEMVMELVNNAVNINNGSLYLGGGYVGIGTSSPTQPLEVNGAIRCSAVLTTSDMTLKKNISKVNNPLEKLDKIDAVYFDWDKNEDNVDRHVGVLAQQVQSVLPEAVRETDSGMAVDYNAVLALAISAIQEQQKQIDQLKAELVEIKAC